MKTRIKSRLVRNTLIAIGAMALPLMASAATSSISVAFDKTELDNAQGQVRVYEQMKSASRKLCGSTNIQFTGSLEKSIGNDDCYDGTLTAAVERLNNDAITALHSE